MRAILPAQSRYYVARMRPLHETTHDDLLGDQRALDRHEFYVDFRSPAASNTSSAARLRTTPNTVRARNWPEVRQEL